MQGRQLRENLELHAAGGFRHGAIQGGLVAQVEVETDAVETTLIEASELPVPEPAEEEVAVSSQPKPEEPVIDDSPVTAQLEVAAIAPEENNVVVPIAAQGNAVQ